MRVGVLAGQPGEGGDGFFGFADGKGAAALCFPRRDELRLLPVQPDAAAEQGQH